MANDDRDRDLSILEAGAQDATLKPRRILANVTVLGMRFCPRRRTDAEYVASVRKMVSLSKWIAAIYAVMAALHFATFLFLYYVVFVVILGPLPEESPESGGSGATLGLGIGVFIGFLLMLAIFSLIQVFVMTYGQRTERLMLKFHDELQSARDGTAPGGSVDQP